MSNIIASDFRPTGIKNLTPGLVERGKIKIGKKGAMRTSSQGNQFQAPEKLDHFTITTTERGQDGNFMTDQKIMQRLGGHPRTIPVRLIYDDISLNFPSRYASYAGKTLACTGDGEQARRLSPDGKSATMVQCPCPRQDPAYQGKDKCKPTGTLSAVIDGADVVGGVWKFRTTSYNSVVGILSSLAMIQRITGGRLAGIPLNLVLSPKTVANPVDGKQQTIYVVSVEFAGSVQALREVGYEQLLQDKTHGARIEQLEDQARRLLADRRDEYEDEAEDIVDEFYPDAAAEAEGVTVHTARPPVRTYTQAAAAEPEQESAPEPETPRRGRPRKADAPAPAPAPAAESQPDMPPAPPIDTDEWGF